MINTSKKVVGALVTAGLVDATRSQEAESVVSRTLGTGAGVPAGRRRSGLVEVAGYAGGALVVAALGLFLATEWSSLSEAGQVATLGVMALVLAAAGVTVSRVGGGYEEMRAGDDDVRRRLASALVTSGAVAAGVAVGVQTEIIADDFSSWPILTGALTILVLAVAGYAYVASAFGQVVVAAAGVTSIINALVVLTDTEDSTTWQGVLIVAFALLWMVTTEAGWFREPVVARAIAVAMALFGAQLPLFGGDARGLAYGLTAAVAALGFGLYLRTASWPYLVAGVAGITLVVPEAIIDWTDGSLGVAGAVLVAGLTLLAASLAGLRVRKEVVEE